MSKLINSCGWLGALCMITASYTINFTYGKALAIIGLGLLMVQSIHLKAHNLTLVNLVAMVGYTVSLIQS